MKLLNYDNRTLIMQNLRTVNEEIPSTYTSRQYRILYNLIKQKKITKQFFDFLLLELYGLSDWKQLSYEEMYELIHVMTFLDYKKVRL